MFPMSGHEGSLLRHVPVHPVSTEAQDMRFSVYRKPCFHFPEVDYSIVHMAMELLTPGSSYLRSLESRARDDQSPRPRADAELASRDQGATPDEANLGQEEDCSSQTGLPTYGPTSARAAILPSTRLPSLQPERSGIPTPATDSSNAEFNTNPLIGGDETFAVGSDGKFCKYSWLSCSCRGFSLIRVLGTNFVLVILSTRPLPDRQSSPRTSCTPRSLDARAV